MHLARDAHGVLATIGAQEGEDASISIIERVALLFRVPGSRAGPTDDDECVLLEDDAGIFRGYSHDDVVELFEMLRHEDPFEIPPVVVLEKRLGVGVVFELLHKERLLALVALIKEQKYAAHEHAKDAAVYLRVVPAHDTCLLEPLHAVLDRIAVEAEKLGEAGDGRACVIAENRE